MNIQEQIGMLTFTPEVKRITFNSEQVKDLRDTMKKLLAVYEAALTHIDKDNHYSRLDLESAIERVQDKQEQT